MSLLRLQRSIWLVLGEQTQLTVEEFYDKFEMELVVVVIDTTN